MTEGNGGVGTILNVNLSTGKITTEPISKETAAKYIGGRGLAARILYDEVGPETDPLGPDNIIVVASGSLEGTRVPTSGRYDLTSKCPRTGIYGASNGGGFFGHEMKRAGYDLIVIRGKSEKPVYLSINDDDVEIRDASHLWGQDTQVTEEMIRDELGDPKIRTLKIGPAGENECFSSCVIGDLSRAAGRMAFGAVWGSKGLKAVAARGSKQTNVARPEELKELCRKLRARAKEDPLYELMTVYGTLGWVWEPGRDPVRHPGTSAEIFKRDFFDKTAACANCDLHCSHTYSVKEGKYKGTTGEGPEAGALLNWRTIDNPAFMLAHNTLCNKLGLDSTFPGIAIERATVLYEKGIITKDDTGGIELRPGDEETVLKLTRMMAYKEGFGKVLDGFPFQTVKVRALSKDDGYITDERLAYGTRTGFHRGSSASSLAFSVATRGGDHLTGMPWATNRGLLKEMTDDVLEKLGQDRYGDPKFFFDRWGASSKDARRVFDLEAICALADMTGTCKFRTEWGLSVAGFHLEDFADLLSAVTGADLTSEDLVKATERQNLIQRAFNAREGLRRKDDYPYQLRWQLEHDMVEHPGWEELGDVTTSSLDKPPHQNLDGYGRMLDEYYKLRGCDLETGMPTREKLEELGLKDVADDLEKLPLIKP